MTLAAPSQASSANADELLASAEWVDTYVPGSTFHKAGMAAAETLLDSMLATESLRDTLIGLIGRGASLQGMETFLTGSDEVLCNLVKQAAIQHAGAQA